MSPKLVALVTGCADPTAIGAAIALEYLKNGYRVFATARLIESMSALGEAGCDLLSLDVTKPDSISAAVRAVSEATDGQLNVLINNAGVTGRSPILDLDLEAAKRVFDVNVWGTISMIQAFAPLLVQTANPEGVESQKRDHAVVVNLGSLGTAIPYPLTSVYAAAKSALQSYGDALKLEMKPLNVHVITVHTGAVQTKMLAGDKASDLRKPETKINSPYYGNSYNLLLEERSKGQEGGVQEGMSPEAFAQGIFRTTVQPSPPRRLFLGGHAWTMKWLLPWFSDALVEKIAEDSYKIQLLKPGFLKTSSDHGNDG